MALNSRPSLANRLLASGIDDLTKYRLVQHFLDQPDAALSAAALARRLGFHSPQLTETALESLVESGVMLRLAVSRDNGNDQADNQAACYRLALASERLATLKALVADADEANRADLYRWLATRSLAHTRAIDRRSHRSHP